MAVVTRVLVGDVRAMLATIEPESVHCVVTSPPYWGLRAYQTAPQVWGGDGSCLDAHEWGDEGRSGTRIRHGQGNTTLHETGPHGTQLHGAQSLPSCDANVTLHPSTGAFCRRCDAWRGELGSEPTPDLFIANLVAVFREVRRVLHPSGTLWLNIGDSYAGSGKGPSNSLQRPASCLNDRQLANGAAPKAWVPVPAGTKPKDLIGIPWMLAFALRADGWWLRGDYIWSKPNPMPESVLDRCTRSHEYVFHFAKAERYFWDAEAIRENWADERNGAPGGKKGAERNVGGRTDGFTRPPQDWIAPEGRSGRNKRSVWEIATAPFAEAHFATFPPKLAEVCVKAGTSERGACPACLAPWRRLTEREVNNSGYPNGPGGNKHRANPDRNESRSPGTLAEVARYDVRTTGWTAGCKCDAGAPVPCRVLDPFAGAGTTGLVADRLGRDSVLVELNPEYAALIRKRISSDAPLFAEVVG